METKLTIQERLRDLRAERGLTLEQLANVPNKEMPKILFIKYLFSHF